MQLGRVQLALIISLRWLDVVLVAAAAVVH
jgi:hypothetical protein